MSRRKKKTKRKKSGRPVGAPSSGERPSPAPHLRLVPDTPAVPHSSPPRVPPEGQGTLFLDLDSAEHYLDEGRAALGRDEVDRAEQCFRRALEAAPVPAAANNLATIQFEHHGAPEDALRTLAPILADTDLPQPFAHALAARCHVAAGRRGDATRHLETAIRHFEEGRRDKSSPAVMDPEAWNEYTAAIIQAAGTVEDDRRAWDLYQRWQALHVAPVSHFFGGIAAFNLGRFPSAVRAWRRVTRPDWTFLRAYCETAALCEAGTIPAFSVEYGTPRDPFRPSRTGQDEGVQQAAASADPEAATADQQDVDAELARGGANRILLLASVLGSLRASKDPAAMEEDTANQLLRSMVALTGDWGEELARRLFADRNLPDSTKIALAAGLVDAERIEPDEPVGMWIDGAWREVTLTARLVFTEPQPGWKERNREAMALLRAGRTDKATELLEQLAFDDDGIWPPAVINYTIALREAGRLEEARDYLELLDEELEDTPEVLFNLAGLCTEMGDPSAAREYLTRLQTLGELSPAIQEKLPSLEQALARAEVGWDRIAEEALQEVQARYEDAMRREVEERPLPPASTTLARALRKIPARWLDVACDLHGIKKPSRHRKEREAQLARHILADPDRCLAALDRLDDDSEARRLLIWLLEQGGFAKSAPLTRRFGSDADDGYFWEGCLPSSPLGRLRALCLAFVGRTNLNNRRHRVAVVPVDLRRPLARHLGLPGTFDT